MKRGREISEDEFHKTLALANCLMALARGGGADELVDQLVGASAGDSPTPSQVFECKTCNRQFTSFQALGGHRASHKRPRLQDGSSPPSKSPAAAAKPKTHECSICGLEFAIGQALGGHMRRHRTAASSENQQPQPIPFPAAPQLPAPAAEKTASRRLLCLDLNLTPMENDLEFRIGKLATPVVDCLT